MARNADRIGLCMVLHDGAILVPFVQHITQLQYAFGGALSCIALVSKSSPLIVSQIEVACQKAGLDILICANFYDEYFDFSAYQFANKYFADLNLRGIVYINDTLISKHNSAYLHSAFRKNVSAVIENAFDFPVLVGPYRKSEFSVGTAQFDDFVSTFMFYLNSAGVEVFSRILDQMPMIESSITRSDATSLGAHTPLLRLCQIHAFQITHRYATDNQFGRRLNQKLTTVFCERMLTGRVRDEGLIWFVASGMFGRIAVPIQTVWFRFFSRLTWRG